MKLRNEFLVLVLAAALVGCSHGQAPVTPPPTVTVSNNAPACPTGYTCGYIYSWATCSNATTCPTPGNPGPGPYTALQTPATALTTASYSGPAPATGVYVAFTVQVVYTNLTPAWTGPPSPASTAQLIALYPPALGAPAVTTIASLAPPLLPSTPPNVFETGKYNVATLAAPTVTVTWHR
jgi:hypothetical protein